MTRAGDVYGDDYRLQRLLGEGGMGAVWVAEQVSTGRERAVKLMHERFVDDSGLRERFVREARVGAMIDSDHVAEVLAAGVEADTGTPWMAMELLAGADLHDYIQEHGPMSLPDALATLRQLCHALGAAHRAGIVHRDLKARNVFLATGRRVDDERVVKVLDFGIAKLLSQSRRTGTEPLGSPGWMPPEQSDPKATIVPAADVWSLGLLTFYLLTGKGFWTAQNDPAASLEALLREVLIEPIPSAHRRSIEQQADPPVGEALDPWFARCLRREPRQRFADADAAFAALEGLVEHGRPIDQPVDPAGDPAGEEPATDRTETPPTEVPTTRDLGPKRRRDDTDVANSDPPMPVAKAPLAARGDGETLASPSAQVGDGRRWIGGVAAVALGGLIGWVALAAGDDSPGVTGASTAAPSATMEAAGDVPATTATASTNRADDALVAAAEPPAVAEATASVSPSGSASAPRPAALPRPSPTPSDEAIKAWRIAAAAVMGARGSAAGDQCGEDVHGTYVTVEVAADGRVESVRASVIPGTENAARTKGCIERAFSGMRFDPPGKPQTISKGLKAKLKPR